MIMPERKEMTRALKAIKKEIRRSGITMAMHKRVTETKKCKEMESIRRGVKNFLFIV